MPLFSSTQPSLRVRVLTRFPANVSAGNGITITKNGQTYIFELSGDTAIWANSTEAVPTGGNTAFGFKVGSGTLGMFWGAGEPTLSADQGSVYYRTDGTGPNDRAYINIDGATAWTPVVTVE